MGSTFEIPFTFGPCASAGIELAGLEPLAYEIVEHDLSQRQFQKRKLIRPCIDLEGYTFKALIDWIEIEIQTGRSTNFHTVQDRLRDLLDRRRPRVTSVGGARHHADTRFTSRIQDPERHQLLEIGPMLHREFGLTAPIRVSGIEIAVDVRPKNGLLRDRLAMVLLLQRHCLIHRPEWTDRKDDARYVYELTSGKSSKPSRVIQGSTRKFGSGLHSDQKIKERLVRERILDEKNHRAPFLDSTLYFGREGGPVMIRIEHKTTDKRDPTKATVVSLDGDSRARIEVRLQGQVLEQLGLQVLDDVLGYRFETLQKSFFSFSLPTVPVSGVGSERLDELFGAKRIEIFRNSGAYGIDRFELAQIEELRQVAINQNKKARCSGNEFDACVLAEPRATVRYRRKAFDHLNGKMKVALRTLARQMGR